MCFQALCGHDWRGGGRRQPAAVESHVYGGFRSRACWARSAVLQHLYQRARTGAGAELGAGLMNAGLLSAIGLIQTA